MHLTLVFAILFLAGALYNFARPDPNFTEGGVGLGISLALGGTYFFTRKQTRANEEFLYWLVHNESGIYSHDAVYEGMSIGPDTEIAHFQAALSFLLISIKVPSRYHVVGQESRLGSAAIFTLISLIFGWWGIPWGPVFTVQTIGGNLRGGTKQRVGELLSACQDGAV
jgi:hypothetical protein